MNYISLFDVSNPPFGWTQSEFIQSLYVLNRFTIEELHSLMIALNACTPQNTFLEPPQEIIPSILRRLSPKIFFEDVYNDAGVIGSLIQQKLTQENLASY